MSKAEEKMIGCAMTDPDAYFATSWLKPEWFSGINAAIWRVIGELYTEQLSVGYLAPDVIAMKVRSSDKRFTDEHMDRLQNMLSKMMNEVSSALYATAYAAEVFKDAVGRRVLDLASEIAQVDSESAEAMIASVNETVEKALAAFVHVEAQTSTEAASTAYESLVHRVEHPGISGIPTGLAQLDLYSGGLQRGELIVLSGRPSMGKTAAMLRLVQACVTDAMLKTSGDVAVFSLEMTTDQLMQRLASSLSGVNSMKLRDGTLTADELTAVGERLGEIATWPVQWSDQPSMTVHEIEQAAWQLYRGARGLSAVFIDQLQLISVPDETKYYNEAREYTRVVKRLRRLAKQLHCPVILLHQINRNVDQRKDKRPVMSDLKGSGGLEEVSDTVLLLYRDEYYNPETDHPSILEWIIGKQRNGMTGMAMSFFQKETGRIRDVELFSIPLDY